MSEYISIMEAFQQHAEAAKEYVKNEFPVKSGAGTDSTIEGKGCTAIGAYSHAEGYYTEANKPRSHAEGSDTIASGLSSHAEGSDTIASGRSSHAEGGNYNNGLEDSGSPEASGECSHAEGAGTIAKGMVSHAEGYCAEATGIYSHAEGYNTKTNGDYGSHAEGSNTQATGKAGSHAEGYHTQATGSYGSHAEGSNTQALAESSHAEGYFTTARGKHSHSSGWRTNAYGRCQFVIGKFNLTEGSQSSENIEDFGKYAFIIGNGKPQSVPGSNTYDNYLRSNAFTVNWGGIATTHSTQTQGADYAEMFEWNDNNPLSEDRIGYLVTLINGNKIQFAQPGDDYLGIISDTTAVLGDSAQFEWQGKYLTDDFGRPIYEEAPEYDEIFNEEAGESEFVIIGTSKQKKLNPNYNPEEAYTPRTERKEWAKVGLLGKIYARDDGSCEVGHYATAGLNGVLTHSTERTNMRVMKRVSENVVLVFLK